MRLITGLARQLVTARASPLPALSLLSVGPSRLFSTSLLLREEESKFLYVGNFPRTSSEEAVRAAFAEHGEMASFRLIKDKYSGSLKGFGFIEYNSLDEAKAALQSLDGEDFEGRPLAVSYASPRDDAAPRRNDAPRRSDPSKSLYLGNLPYTITEDVIREVFGEHGELTSVRIPIDMDTQQPKGFAFIEYTTVEDAQATFDRFSGQEFEGRRLRIDFNDGQSRGGRGGGRGASGGRGGYGSDRGGRGGYNRGGDGGGGYNRGGGGGGGYSREGGGGYGNDRGGRGGYGGRGGRSEYGTDRGDDRW